jgi:hypothetical protein
VGQKEGKKEKRKETPIQSFPMYIRLTRDQTLVSGFPANDHSREIKTLEKP